MVLIATPTPQQLRRQRLAIPTSLPSYSTKDALEASARVLASLATNSEIKSQADPLIFSGSLEEQLFDARAACKRKTSQVAMHLSQEHRTKLFAQLDALLEYEDWEPEDKPVSVESFTTFLRLLIFIDPAVRPGLGAGYEGEIVAAWKKNENILTITCMPNDSIQWIVVLHDGEEIESSSGQAHVERIKSLLQPFYPDQWFLREEKSEDTE